MSGPASPATPRKGSRSKARKRALDILFESEARSEDAQEVLARRIAGADAPPVSDFAASLVEGVVSHRDEIDEVISSYARGWTMARMPAVDRMILRIGVFEIRYSDDVPDPVAIDEAIDLARELSTDDSPRFVNGVLAGVSSGRPGTVAPPSPDRVDLPAGVELAAGGDGADGAPADGDEPSAG
ncbi:NusB antitermination factor [Actinomycetospora succinea]|uniref:Transcription antitermination protein NusB n=1 Tax=Actinomycetospora succinea TaxID=663603 RepID=A0A4R6UID8_9PSEU|nr:transcription antitermination factor NusB [Actinomycetospora succinea]TDQ46212.1 NusB antitermination factor [Actinomycetospora succinea]